MEHKTVLLNEAIEYLNAHGAKLGVLKVHLYRPFPTESFLKASKR